MCFCLLSTFWKPPSQKPFWEPSFHLKGVQPSVHRDVQHRYVYNENLQFQGNFCQELRQGIGIQEHAFNNTNPEKRTWVLPVAVNQVACCICILAHVWEVLGGGQPGFRCANQIIATLWAIGNLAVGSPEVFTNLFKYLCSPCVLSTLPCGIPSVSMSFGPALSIAYPNMVCGQVREQLPVYSLVTRLLKPRSWPKIVCQKLVGWPHTEHFLKCWRKGGHEPLLDIRGTELAQRDRSSPREPSANATWQQTNIVQMQAPKHVNQPGILKCCSVCSMSVDIGLQQCNLELM